MGAPAVKLLPWTDSFPLQTTLIRSGYYRHESGAGFRGCAQPNSVVLAAPAQATRSPISCRSLSRSDTAALLLTMTTEHAMYCCLKRQTEGMAKLAGTDAARRQDNTDVAPLAIQPSAQRRLLSSSANDGSYLHIHYGPHNSFFPHYGQCKNLTCSFYFCSKQ
jgi:hypothetical protein